MLKKTGALFLSFILLAQAEIAGSALPLADSQGQPIPTLAPLIEKTTPAVVNIATRTTRTVNNPLLNDPFFRHFFNLPPNYTPRREVQSAGSGVIIDKDEGIVVSNHHVVEGADEIKISLHDGREFIAKLVGSDPEVDIAVLKIDAKNLNELPLSDSDQVKVGDFSVAIGNPFGLNQTVTTGVISALGRSGLGIEGYENFIQTDASINPGNSGGALINLRGELIGINTAILAPSGGNVGIGFAIPINMAMASVRQILKYGEVKRGKLGIAIQDLTRDLINAFDLPKGTKGVLVSQVEPGSGAAKAGIQEGDVILELNGKPVRTAAELRNAVGLQRPGETVSIELLRKGKVKKVEAKISDDETGGGTSGQKGSMKPLGERFEGAQFENAPDGKGVLVAEVEPGSRAMYAGLRSGDLIVSINRQPVKNVKELKEAVEKDKKQTLLRIIRGNFGLYLVIR